MPAYAGRKKRACLFFGLKLTLTVMAFVFLFYHVPVRVLGKELASARLPLVMAALIILFVRLGLAALRWNTLLSHHGFAIPFSRLFNWYLVGYFFNAFLPTSTGGDLVRGGCAASTVGKVKAFSSVITERMFGLFALFIISTGAWLAVMWLKPGYLPDTLVMKNIKWFTGLGVLASCGLLAAAVMLGVRLEHWKPKSRLLRGGAEVLKALAVYGGNFKVFSLTLLYSILFQLVGIISVWLLGKAVGAQFQAWSYFFLLPLVWVASMIPVSISGLGIREGAFVFLFAGFGMPRETALSISLLWLVIMYAQCLVGGLVFLLNRNSFQRLKVTSGGIDVKGGAL